MGKAYARELLSLAETYHWAREVSLGPLVDFTVASYARPLLAIGSGGSATAGHLAAMLHRGHSAAFARHATPLEILLEGPSLRDAAVLLLSASGKNRDVLEALQRSIDHEARAVATLCTRVGSQLAAAARRFERSYIFEADAPAGRDGFLATNSLLATCTIIARAYGLVLPDLIFSHDLDDADDAAERSTALVLHGGWGAPVATDLESKLNESSLASAHISDYRNFGHGRHFWLARRGSETVVIALVTPQTEGLADRTLALLPTDIPVVVLRTPHHGAAGTIDLLIQGFHLVGRLGKRQGLDPGRPRVPAYGRKLYHLVPAVPSDDVSPPAARKLTISKHFTPTWHDEVYLALERFVHRLSTTRIGGIVLDYDGTLCTHSERFGALRPAIVDALYSAIEQGLLIGIATGRGRSVRQALQESLPRSVWQKVLIGYYNGGDLGSVAENNIPCRNAPVEAPLSLATDRLQSDPLLSEIATLTLRRRQITVEPKVSVATHSLLSHVMTVLAPMEEQGIRALASSHSVDVLPPGVGKLSVVEALKHRAREGTEVLCIGDRGAWPGNDCALLSHVPSLSVDEVSASLETCWNLAPAGTTGIHATLLYFKALEITDCIAAFDARDLWSRS